MSGRLRVAPIVEGHGEYDAVPILLRRIWHELLGGSHIDVLRPIRVSKSKIVRGNPHGTTPRVATAEISRAAELARRKIRACAESMPFLILILLDADSDCPAQLAPQLLGALGSPDVACVIANVEFETWFVASAETLGDYLTVDESPPADPEKQRCGKAWIERRFRGQRYSERVDQPRITARISLAACRANSPSFDKLCRELERMFSSG